MKKMGLNELREKFLAFFESKDHLRLPSHSLVPSNDKSLLLINSGMAPLKPYFTGQETPPSKRVVTCQKCIRTGDIENVGRTARHGTFFEMLGDFSFGDYFKEEIIPWSWEFVTEVLEIPADRLYASIYLEDEEAYEIWSKKIGLSDDRIVRLGKEDNFWEVGLGPCGPCSEIYYDRGEKYGCGSADCTVGCDCDRYMEFWNLVFTQFDKQEDGSYPLLPKPNIDTGMGLERMACIMQDVYSIFDVDTIRSIRDEVCKISGKVYESSAKDDVSIRVITDHIRSITFMTADGVLPSNEGRGYVLRRLLRRAARHGKLLGIGSPFLASLAESVIANSQGAYPELMDKKDYILKVISIEENKFYETLDQGMEILRTQVQKLKELGKDTMPGKETFFLYDTYGFPPDLTREILAEQGIGTDEKGFEQAMENQRSRARAAREDSTFMGSEKTVYHDIDCGLSSEFLGYAKDKTESVILAIVQKDSIVEEAREGDEVSVILDVTPFYAESGGQKGDRGVIETTAGAVEIKDCIKAVGGKIAHIGAVTRGTIKVGDKAEATIDIKRRNATARNHSATHLLQKTLREVLGSHVEQAGSLVSAERLRFDFTHFAPLSEEELRRVEKLVNEKILEGLPIEVSERTIDEARAMGATALFGEKYGNEVRVVDMGGYSMELCGGTHLSNTAQIGVFKLISDSGIASGVRRIEALTGQGALEYYRELESKLLEIGGLVKSTPADTVKRVGQLLEEFRESKREVERLRSKMSGGTLEEILKASENINGINLVMGRADGMDMNAMRDLSDRLKEKAKSCVVVLAGSHEEKANMVIMVTDDLVKSGIKAGDIIKEAIKEVDGKGGGRPNMAQAAGKNLERIDAALERAKEIIKLAKSF